MPRALVLLTRVLYAWSATEMHEWVRVPQVVAHLLEHHSDFGHHDPDGPGHHHDDVPDQEHDHSPFDDGCHNEFCACSGMAVVLTAPQPALQVPTAAMQLAPEYSETDFASFSGSKWNPPKA